MGIKAETIYIEVDAKISKALADLKKTDTSSNKLFDSFKKLAGPAAIGAVVLGAIKLGSEFSKAASNAEEIGSKFNTIFRDMADDANSMADGFADSFGLAGSSARELLGNTADLLTGFGLTQSAAADVSLATNELAADLASFSNAQGGAAAVSAALTSAYSGEREALKTYGIVINDAMVKAQLLKQETEGLTFASEQQAKIAATLTLATQQSGNAIGDVARTFNSHANVTRRLEESTKQLKEELGKSVNEGMTPMLVITDKIVKSIAVWVKKNNEVNSFFADWKDGAIDTKVEMDTLNDALIISEARLKQATDAGRGHTEGLEAEVAALKIAIGQRARAAALDAQFADAKKAQDQAEIDRIAREQKANNQAIADMDALKDAFAGTTEGEIEAVKASIAYFETFKQGTMATAVLEDLREQLAGLTEESIQSAQDIFDGKTPVADEWREAELARIIEIADAEQEAADESIRLANAVHDAKIALMSTSFAFAKTLLDNDTKANEDHARRNFNIAKALSISEAAVNTFLAITKALTVDPTGILATIVGATGAIQIAAIASEPPPAFATGGSFVTNGQENITVGDNASGSERVTVEPLGGSNNSNGSMVLNIDGEQFIGWVQNQFDNRRLRIPRGSIVS